MAENSFPFENQNNSEGDWSKLIGSLAETGVLSGLNVTAGAGMSVNVAAGSGIVQGFYYENTAPKNLAVGASHATLTRIDYIILKLDLAANTITALVKAGVAGGAAPALTQNTSEWEFPIATITIPGALTNIVTGNIVETLTGSGLRAIPYTTATKPTPAKRTLGYDLTLGKLEYFNGATWSDVIVPWASVSGKPGTFAPTAHTHAQADVTNLVTDLAALSSAIGGKAATVHTHTAAQISDSTSKGRSILTAADRDAVRTAIGLFVTNTPMTVANAVGDVRLW